MPDIIVIGLIAAVIVTVVVLVVRGARSRSERSDWLGELTEIRRSSLGDDEEVTGALEAVSVDEEPVEPTGPEESTGSVAAERRTVTDAGTRFDEYAWSGFAVLRIEAPESGERRVLDAGTGTERRIAVELPHGVLWFRPDPVAGQAGCAVHVPGGWVLGDGLLLVLADATGWSYVMCLTGRASIRFDGSGQRVAMTAGQVGRLRAGTDDHDIVAVGADALESEGLVRRQRRLDGIEAR